MMTQKQENKTDWRIVIAVIAGITVLELGALYRGFNGVLLTSVIGILALLAGLSMPQLKFK